MTRDADNDNSSGAPGRASEQRQAWQGLSNGNAALADQPSQEQLGDSRSLEIGSQPDAGDTTSETHQSEDLGSSEEKSDVVIPPDVSENDKSISPATFLPNSDAIPIGALGISMPQRPIPAGRPLEIRRPQARRNTPRRDTPENLGRQGNEHLFNRPPGAARVQPEPSPMEKAINTKPRVPLTSQPGFLAGLVAALVCGGAYYGYLVF